MSLIKWISFYVNLLILHVSYFFEPQLLFYFTVTVFVRGLHIELFLYFLITLLNLLLHYLGYVGMFHISMYLIRNSFID